jgi:hypothetical protein
MKRFLAVLALGCSGGGDTTDAAPDAGMEAEAGPFVTASHTPMPQATSLGGAVIKTPKMVAISFANDGAMQPTIDAFATQLQANPAYWMGATSEYGIGALTTTTFHSADKPNASLTDADVRAWLTNAIQNVTGFPQPDANTVYTLFYGMGINVSALGGVTCQQFQGYHDSFMVGSQSVIYAIVPRCPPPPVPNVTSADQMTAEASHEIVEAATDPLPTAMPTYITVDSSSYAWAMLAGGEVGDLCAVFPDSFYKPSGFTTLVQRTWSNAAAMADHDPCAPNGTSPYFNSAPILPDTIHVNAGGGNVTTKGIMLKPGQNKVVELDLYSDAPTSGPWTVSAFDITSAFFGGTKALSFSFDTTSGQNGDKIMMTVNYLTAVPGGAPFWIESDLGQPTDGGGFFTCLPPSCQATVWLAAVSNF